MKYFLNASTKRLRWTALAALMFAIGATIAAAGELPSWIRNVKARTAIEAAFFRMMSLPGGAVAFRRPPSETRPAITALIKAQPGSANLFSLRALEDEQALDFTAAEADWKVFVDHSSEKIDAQIALADFYHRRVRRLDEIEILSAVANAAPASSEKLSSVSQQRSWQAFERIFAIIQVQGLPKGESIVQYRAWIKRYPDEPSLYGRFMQFLVAQKEYATAADLINDYRKQFPNDQIFPVKAKATVEYRRGSVQEGLSVYEKSFQPLWDPQLVKSYFDLLRDTQNLRKFRDDASAAIAAYPQDLNAAVRLFYYYQQQGNLEAAQEAISEFRSHKDATKAHWTSQEIYICARLLEEVHAYPESARYYFALYNSRELPDAQENTIASLASILLTAPETPIRFGSGDLSMYRDIATLDPGPGYLNGILSLILNTSQPAAQYSEEEQKAVPYFHRARAAELLTLLDQKFPKSSRRAGLHAQLLEFYANSGESDAVIQGGRAFLDSFPNAPERTSVALLMADAYARKQATKDEFAIYDSVLQELAAKAQNVPLGTAAAAYESVANYDFHPEPADEASVGYADPTSDAAPQGRTRQSFQFSDDTSSSETTGPRSPEYARLLERYLARLSEMKQIPAALAVLRREIDRNSNDPGLYERLASFLDQNRLGAQQEEVYRLAISRFADKSWYDKLARFYLRHKRDGEFEALTRDAVASFHGSELEEYFNHVVGGSPELYLRLNLYANQRFPHNPVFVRNLLSAYESGATRDSAAWEALLRQHWFEGPALRSRFFEFLARTGRLDNELAAVRDSAPDPVAWHENPAAANFIANANLWRSHFEESAAPLQSLATQFPAESEIDHTASSVYRSLAYFDPADTALAAKIEDGLLQANPGDSEIMARIGDIYADRDQFSNAAPYWERIPQITPGKPDGYLETATIYWDYFDFESALRWLASGRSHLSNPNLYAYEAGAIYENQRDYDCAVDEYVKGALAAPDSSAELRLLQLARRPQFRDLIDQKSATIASMPSPSMTAVTLRVKILEAQNRKAEMEKLLDSITAATGSIEQAEEIETLAQRKSLETVRQHAIEKQTALTSDPLTRLQLRYSLVRIYEGRKDFVSAQKNVEALYHESPKILGVVRSTVDFYWRMKMQQQAVAVLLQASKDAYPAMSVQFRFEAARKSTEARQFDQARDLLSRLLKDTPYNGEYLAAMADTYAQAGDDRGLQQFYLDEMALFRNAQLSSDERKAQIATVRRGLIPPLTRMKNYSGAVDQYIELVNLFPEDESLATESSLYALRYQRQQQLVDFYVGTVARSPRDSRWSVILAHIYANLEKYPAAIDMYAKASAIRPDRVDLYIARAELEERLMRLDEAAADYEHIYELAYRDRQWMEKVAEVRARQGKVSEVVGALKAALIDGRPENPENYFEIARRLEAWGMLDRARSFAEQGASAAGSELLANAEYHAGAKVYVRIMTRLRQQETAFTTLRGALDNASASLPVLKEQMVKQGVSSLTDGQWRENLRRRRVETARSGMESALIEMGSAVNTYFTPEERVRFARFAEAKHNEMNADDVERSAIPLAVNAALADQETRWRFESLLHRAKLPNPSLNVQPLVDLQQRRGRFAELAAQMEQLAAALPWQERASPLTSAADGYRTAGDEQSELRTLAVAYSFNFLDASRQERFFQLLLQQQPQELVRIASLWPSPSGEQAANFAIAHANPALAHEVVHARSKPRPKVWDRAYDALVGLYFAEPAEEVNRAFLSALGNSSIGERLAGPVDRAQQLAGGTWFYYGSRYGEYLDTTKQGTAEDFLPAALEESPASESGYSNLADYYLARGDTKNAIADYKHTLELSSGRPDVYDKLAVAYYKQGDRSTAIEEWKLAFDVLSKELGDARVPESFWRDFGRTCDDLSSRHLFAELKPEADAIVRLYLRRNGSWRSNAILQSFYAADGDSLAATSWLLDVSSVAQDPASILGDVVEASWIPMARRGVIYQRILELKEQAVEKLDGIERENALLDLGSWQQRHIQYLVLSQQYAAAAVAINSLPQETRDARSAALLPLELQSAAKIGTLDSILSKYEAEPEKAPAPALLRDAARRLLAIGEKQSARKILELAFQRDIEDHKLEAESFLGLADIRIASGDTAGAVDLLRRLIVSVGSPFENIDAATALLEKTGHNAEAVEFLDQLVKAEPWDASYRLRRAKAQTTSNTNVNGAQSELSSIASNASVSYDVRQRAAAALTGLVHADLGSHELDLIAAPSATLTESEADKFYFYNARVKAADRMSDARSKVELLSRCVIDFPRRNDARVALFEAAIADHSDRYALGILEPILQTLFPLWNGSAVSNEDETLAGSAGGEEQARMPSSAFEGLTAQMSRTRPASLAQMIADAMKRVDRLQNALSYYQMARRLEPSPAKRKMLAEEIAEVKTTLSMQRENAARQPLLHEALEQDRVVRPKLMARTSTASRAGAARGVPKP